jgi:uncharacterized membrane protein
MADPVILVLKVAHVGGAMLWLGGAAFYATIANNALRGGDRRARVDGLLGLMRNTVPFFPVAGIVTLLAGFELARRTYGTVNPLAWAASGVPGAGLIALGMGLALLAFVVGFTTVPLHKRLEVLAATPWDAATEREVDTLLRRVQRLDVADLGLLGLVAVLMVGANLGGF